MKNLITILCLCSFLFSEEYICSGSLENFDTSTQKDKKVEVKTYEREKNRFIKNSQYGESYFDILDETESFIVLTQTYSDQSLYVVFIDKIKKTFYENYLNVFDQ